MLMSVGLCFCIPILSFYLSWFCLHSKVLLLSIFNYALVCICKHWFMFIKIIIYLCLITVKLILFYAIVWFWPNTHKNNVYF
jgi:hypothetical protein